MDRGPIDPFSSSKKARHNTNAKHRTERARARRAREETSGPAAWQSPRFSTQHKRQTQNKEIHRNSGHTTRLPLAEPPAGVVQGCRKPAASVFRRRCIRCRPAAVVVLRVLLRDSAQRRPAAGQPRTARTASGATLRTERVSAAAAAEPPRRLRSRAAPTSEAESIRHKLRRAMAVHLLRAAPGQAGPRRGVSAAACGRSAAAGSAVCSRLLQRRPAGHLRPEPQSAGVRRTPAAAARTD